MKEDRRPMRRYPVILLAMAVAGGAVAACTHRPSPDNAGSCGPHTGVTAPATPPGGAGLRVVEQGFSQVGRMRETVSLGAVTTHHTATDRSAQEPQSGTVRFTDEATFCGPVHPR